MLRAALKTPFGEGPSEVRRRISRRKRGWNPSVLDEIPNTAAAKKLSIGGSGGRGYGDKTAWNLHGASLPHQEEVPEQSTNVQPTGKQRDGRFRIVDLDNLEDAMSTMDCRCDSDSEVDSFKTYCVANDPTLSESKMEQLI